MPASDENSPLRWCWGGHFFDLRGTATATATDASTHARSCAAQESGKTVKDCPDRVSAFGAHGLGRTDESCSHLYPLPQPQASLQVSGVTGWNLKCFRRPAKDGGEGSAHRGSADERRPGPR